MNQKNEIILKVKVISEPKEVALFKLESNLNKETFFLCDEKMGEKNFTKAGEPNELEMASYDELNSENCEMYLDNKKYLLKNIIFVQSKEYILLNTFF